MAVGVFRSCSCEDGASAQVDEGQVGQKKLAQHLCLKSLGAVIDCDAYEHEIIGKKAITGRNSPIQMLMVDRGMATTVCYGDVKLNRQSRRYLNQQTVIADTTACSGSCTQTGGYEIANRCDELRIRISE